MTQDEFFARISAKLPHLEKAEAQIKDYLTLRVKSPAELLKTVKTLKDDLGFNYLKTLTAVDWLGPVKAEGYVRNPNPNVFLPEGATPQVMPGPTPGVNYRPVFEMVWGLANIDLKALIFLKLEVPRDNPVIPSLSGLFKTADWQERETYDLLGVQFQGHPNLTKILTPDFMKGHPLRKDYVHVNDEYDEV